MQTTSVSCESGEGDVEFVLYFTYFGEGHFADEGADVNPDGPLEDNVLANRCVFLVKITRLRRGAIKPIWIPTPKPMPSKKPIPHP